jgi:hypothetical protein
MIPATYLFPKSKYKNVDNFYKIMLGRVSIL